MLRLRQLDIETLVGRFQQDWDDRFGYISSQQSTKGWFDNVYNYVVMFRKCGRHSGQHDSSSDASKTELDIIYRAITNISNSAKDARLRKPLNLMYGVYAEYLSDGELQRIDDRAERYGINFDDITVEELRIRI